MTDYICAGCNNPISSGTVGILEGQDPLYFHFSGDDKCMETYQLRSKTSCLALKLVPFCDLMQKTQTPPNSQPSKPSYSIDNNHSVFG